MATADKPSKTAEVATAARAIHLIRDNPPVFTDDLAYSMCNGLWRTIASSKFLTRIVIDGLLKDIRPIGTVVYTRAKYCDDEVLRAVEDGIEQIVILGAGYDTFAMRHRDIGERVTIFELDQPATQIEKRTRMQRQNIAEPDNVRYVSADLNKEDLFDVLNKGGYDATKPTVFSWFGVTYYLPKETIESALQNIARHSAPKSVVMFDFLYERSNIDPEWLVLNDKCAKMVARKGESWISAFDPDSMTDFVGNCGYSEVDIVTPDQINAKYFSDRSDSLVYPAMIGFCRAVT